MKNNKGLSEIVATLITILLVLVAVGIIWVVVKNVIGQGVDTIDYSSKCMAVDIRATSVTCDGAVNSHCQATVSRSGGGDEIQGIKVIYYNASGTKNYIQDYAFNIAPLVTDTVPYTETGLAEANKVEVSAYFKDSSGIEHLCAPSTFTF